MATDWISSVFKKNVWATKTFTDIQCTNILQRTNIYKAAVPCMVVYLCSPKLLQIQKGVLGKFPGRIPSLSEAHCHPII